jgi:hypothetical protein
MVFINPSEDLEFVGFNLLCQTRVDLDKVPSSIFKPFFEARSMISHHSMHVTCPSRVFIAVL